MKIVVLAAGKGTRLYPLTKNKPQMLIEIHDGVTLIEKQIELFAKSDIISEVVYVVGYMAEQIEESIPKLSKKFKISIKTVYNPFYNISNNLASLWLARNELENEVMITNGDNLFLPQVFKNIKKINEKGIFLTISFKDKYGEDDMKVTLTSDGHIQAVGKEIEPQYIHAQSVGLTRLNGARAVEDFKKSLAQLVRDEKNLNRFWLETFNHLNKRNIHIYTFEIDGSTEWQEIDFHLDINLAKKMIISSKKLFEKNNK